MKKFLAITLIFLTNFAFADISMVVNKLKPFFPEMKAENISTSELDGLLSADDYKDLIH